MKKLLLLSFFSVSINFAFGQIDTVNYNNEFTKVDIEAQFPGGAQAWKRYLERNLNVGLVDSCNIIKKGEKTAKQTVIVSFKVDKDGIVTEVVAENAKDVFPLLAAEAVRVIKRGPKWVPAMQNGRLVIFRQRQSISWVAEK